MWLVNLCKNCWICFTQTLIHNMWTASVWHPVNSDACMQLEHSLSMTNISFTKSESKILNWSLQGKIAKVTVGSIKFWLRALKPDYFMIWQRYRPSRIVNWLCFLTSLNKLKITCLIREPSMILTFFFSSTLTQRQASCFSLLPGVMLS